MAKERGFTLIEIMVVFAILALVMSIAPSAYDRMKSSMEYRDVVRGVVTEMRAARQQAVLTGVETAFAVDLEQKQYGIEGGKGRGIPDSVELRAIVANNEAKGSRFAIRFLPSGGASGGSVDVLRMASGGGVRVRADWFSGRVEQEPVQR
ncbi:prepilin-type N-terminal cleavage/methylation domain-containing protein [Diaphorobacter ruginosibacter]|uniref:Type II secretion system protein H n=2 Tax=Diaphorobacter ruginosibacter TaxID=1715720 RepID=A0A7G9RQF7_9BURK|nr:prepilin-type N-terminal cleavage/methylation domain-containing protein [Diaphorobacter ruginosibacter]